MTTSADRAGFSCGDLKCGRTAGHTDVQIVQRTVARLPVGVVEWETKLIQTLPQDLKASLSTTKEVEAELASEESLTRSDKGEA